MKTVRNLTFRGFTLVEIMAVMVLVALLTGTAAVGITAAIRKGRIRATRTQLSTLDQAISMFELECAFSPTTLDDLVQAPTARRCRDYPKETFLEKGKLPLDAWGGDFQYDSSGSRSGFGYDLWSNGKDGEEGTDDDVVGWEVDDSSGDDDQ